MSSLFNNPVATVARYMDESANLTALFGEDLVPIHKPTLFHFTGQKPVPARQPFYIGIAEAFRIVLSRDLRDQQEETLQRLITRSKGIMKYVHKEYGAERLDLHRPPLEAFPDSTGLTLNPIEGVVMWIERENFSYSYRARIFMVAQKEVTKLG